MASLRGQMEDFFDHFFHRLSRTCQESGLTAFADWLVEEDDQRLLLKLQAPDVSPEDIEVTLKGEMLTVTLRKEQVTTQDEAATRQEERSSQSCTHTVRIAANIKRDEISAQYANGILSIELPKAESKVYRIPIKD